MKLNTSERNLRKTCTIIPHRSRSWPVWRGTDNLGVLARDLVTDHDIIQVDMRNHVVYRRAIRSWIIRQWPKDLLDTL